MARTFIDSNHMVLTASSGPTEADIERRVVRNVATGRIIDESEFHLRLGRTNIERGLRPSVG